MVFSVPVFLSYSPLSMKKLLLKYTLGEVSSSFNWKQVISPVNGGADF